MIELNLEQKKLILELGKDIWEKYHHLDKTDCLFEADAMMIQNLNYVEKNPEQMTPTFWFELSEIWEAKKKTLADATALLERLEGITK